MLLPPDTAAFFAVFFDFPLTFAEDLQFCGISHPVRVLMPGDVLKRTLTDRARLLTRVSSGQRSGAPIRVKMESIKQGQPNNQNSGDGRVRTALRPPPGVGCG